MFLVKSINDTLLLEQLILLKEPSACYELGYNGWFFCSSSFVTASGLFGGSISNNMVTTLRILGRFLGNVWVQKRATFSK
jgi:hypothetical protein